MEIIISSLISSLSAIVVCALTNHFQNKKTTILMEYKIDMLTEQVKKHNSVIDRTYALQKQQAVFDEEIKVANHRINDLEQARA